MVTSAEWRYWADLCNFIYTLRATLVLGERPGSPLGKGVDVAASSRIAGICQRVCLQLLGVGDGFFQRPAIDVAARRLFGLAADPAVAVRINLVQSGCNRFSNNVVSYSRGSERPFVLN